MDKSSSLFYEILRKTLHLSGLLIIVGYTLILNFISARAAILAMTALLLIFLEIEYIRLEHRSRLVAVFDGFFRKREKDNLSGAVFVVISCIICFAAFDYWIAVLAMFMTVLGDFFSALIGKFFGRTILYNNKTIVGSFAGLLANLTAGVLILPDYLIIVLPMAFVASFTEVITNKLDDNLTVPLFSGFIGQIIVYYFSINLPEVYFTFLGLFS